MKFGKAAKPNQLILYSIFYLLQTNGKQEQTRNKFLSERT